MSNLQNPIFQDDDKAREWLEARVWPNGPVCPHCGVTSEHVTKLEGAAHRPGVYQCNECREQFTVTVKTVFERGGRVRTFHPAMADGPTVTGIVRDNIAREAQLMTDESNLYKYVGQIFASHGTVTHSHDEYVRYEGDRVIYTNTVEGYFSI